MGSDRGSTVGAVALSRVAQVIPNVPSFSVDDGFAYAIPEAISDVGTGRMVRVPLGGRVVRGYVVGVREVDDTARLREVRAVSGDYPLFGERLLQTLRWTALHYVAPVSTVLAKTAPPNLPRIRKPLELEAPPSLDSPLPEVSAAAGEGRRVPSQYLVGSGPWGEVISGLCSPVAAGGRSTMVVAPTVIEAERVVDTLRRSFGRRVLFATSSSPAREVTAAWVHAATTPGVILVGTREIALWPLADLGLAVIVEEGRRAMKAAQSPTLHAFQLLRRRAAVERFSLVLTGPVPTVEALAGGTELHEPPRRVWGLIEVVDRGEEPPGSGIISPQAARALQGAVKRGASAFVLVHRRDYAPAFRCVRCRAVRLCSVCGAGAARTDGCRRCDAVLGPCTECGGERFEPLGAGVGRAVDALRRIVGDQVGPVETGRLVTVGTERDLVGIGRIQLGVVVDADGLILAPHYRAEEDAFRLLARLASLVVRGRGNRCLVQTSRPHHQVIEALRSGHPTEFLVTSLRTRERDGFPPATELVALGLKRAPEAADDDLRTAAGDRADVLGPAADRDALQWLLQGADLRPARVRLRSLVQSWRDGGATVRVDADPIDL